MRLYPWQLTERRGRLCISTTLPVLNQEGAPRTESGVVGLAIERAVVEFAEVTVFDP